MPAPPPESEPAIVSAVAMVTPIVSPIVVPDSYIPYFTATATAAGALIGLLFVAVTLRPDSIFGELATPTGRLIASSAFTALVNAFFVSVLALIPGVNLGVGAGIVAVISISSTISSARKVHWQETGWRLLGLALAAYLAEIVFGVQLTIDKHAPGAVNSISYILIGSFSVALGRAWALVEGSTLGSKPGS